MWILDFVAGQSKDIIQANVGGRNVRGNVSEDELGAKVDFGISDIVNGDDFFRLPGLKVVDYFGAGRSTLHLGQVEHHVIGPKGNIIGVEILPSTDKIG